MLCWICNVEYVEQSRQELREKSGYKRNEMYVLCTSVGERSDQQSKWKESYTRGSLGRSKKELEYSMPSRSSPKGISVRPSLKGICVRPSLKGAV